MEEANANELGFQRRLERKYRCPTCNVTLNPNEVEDHCKLEVSRLLQSSKTNLKCTINDQNQTSRKSVKPCLWRVYRRVQKNRKSRLKKRPHKSPIAGTNNDVFNAQINSDVHFDMDKYLTPGNGQIEEDNSCGNEEVFEEYEWAGQKRIRISSLLEGGYASIGVGTNKSVNETDEDEYLNVDEDDTHLYGPPQYSECDIVAFSYSKKDSSEEYHTNNYVQSEQRILHPNDGSANQEENKRLITGMDGNENSRQESFDENHLKSAEQIITSLKFQLRQWESHIQNKFKCLICLDEYHNPAISVSCWHVHCENCWLRSLAVRKLCPQCNLITSPLDLRRIYM